MIYYFHWSCCLMMPHSQNCKHPLWAYCTNIFPYAQLSFYETVYYLMPTGQFIFEKKQLGRWLGVSKAVMMSWPITFPLPVRIYFNIYQWIRNTCKGNSCYCFLESKKNCESSPPIPFFFF